MAMRGEIKSVYLNKVEREAGGNMLFKHVMCDRLSCFPFSPGSWAQVLQLLLMCDENTGLLRGKPPLPPPQLQLVLQLMEQVATAAATARLDLSSAVAVTHTAAAGRGRGRGGAAGGEGMHTGEYSILGGSEGGIGSQGDGVDGLSPLDMMVKVSWGLGLSVRGLG